MRNFILVISVLSLVLLGTLAHAQSGCGTDDQCNDPDVTDIENGGNVGRNDPDDVDVDFGGNEGRNDEGTNIDNGGNVGTNR